MARAISLARPAITARARMLGTPGLLGGRHRERHGWQRWLAASEARNSDEILARILAHVGSHSSITQLKQGKARRSWMRFVLVPADQVLHLAYAAFI